MTDLATAATGSIAVAGRRTAVVAASSGLMVSMVAVPAHAVSSAGDAVSLPSVDTAALTASARAMLDTAPVVTAPADAAWTFEAPAAVAEPEPAPVVVPASRSARRTAAPAPAPAVANAPVPQSAAGNAVLEIAARYIGTPYVTGGTTPDGFDCSGFVSYVFAQFGISLPHQSGAIKGSGTVVSAADAQPGDIIWSPGHVAIYAGGGQQIDAPSLGKSVQFRNIWQSSVTFIRIG